MYPVRIMGWSELLQMVTQQLLRGNTYPEDEPLTLNIKANCCQPQRGRPAQRRAPA